MSPSKPILAALALAACIAAPSVGSACAVLPVQGGARPGVTLERVAILYDEGRELEHFVREVRFNGATSAFTFVVPTPSVPELGEVKASPFDDLARDLPLDPPPEPPSTGFFGGEAKSAAPPAQVAVLSTQRVGKFQAFVLAAEDSGALAKWLGENRIALPEGGQAWLDHYVQLKFFFTAFRYDEPPPRAPNATMVLGDGAPMTSETVRLSFKTRLPFFPYLEPAHAASPPEGHEEHEMNVWLFSQRRRAPRLRRFLPQESRWGFPWQSRLAYQKKAPELGALGELQRLLPSDGRFFVQTFRDERTNRDGFGDIVFPEADASLDQGSVRALVKELLGNLDKGLQTSAFEPGELDHEETFRVAPSLHSGCACSLGAHDESRGVWLGVAAVGLLFARRARRSSRQGG